MIEHRNVSNFFTAMDEALGVEPDDRAGVWLAVTSISFDISVLELLWTLTRGFTVVLQEDEGRARDVVARHRATSRRVRPADGLQPLLLRRRRRRAHGRPVPAADRGGQVRRPARLRRGVDARAPLPRVRRSVPEPGGHQRGRRRGHRAASRSAPAASCCRCTTRSGSPRTGPSWTTCPTDAWAVVRLRLARQRLRAGAGQLRRRAAT